jgi:hypothetical protein
MSSLAEFIPIELVNHILSFRPRHPDAELIKEFKDSILNKYKEFLMRRGLELLDKDFELTFKEIDISRQKIFSSEIIYNCIYRIKTKKYKTSEGFYWGKFYTYKKASDEYDKYTNFINFGDMYSVELVTIDNDSLEEDMVEKTEYEPSDSDYDSEESEESEENYSHKNGCGCGCNCQDERLINYEYENYEDYKHYKYKNRTMYRVKK